MRRLAIALFLTLLPGLAAAAGLSIDIDQAARVTLPRPAHDVMVGNPTIADVTIADQRHLVITGKTYGVTNLMVSDAAGQVIFSRQIVVGSPDENRVSVYRGVEAVTYACSRRCEKTTAPGASAPAPVQPTP